MCIQNSILITLFFNRDQINKYMLCTEATIVRVKRSSVILLSGRCAQFSTCIQVPATCSLFALHIKDGKLY